MPESKTFPDDLRNFVNSSRWTFAKTMPKWPHEYIVRERVDEKLFVQLVCHIRANGYFGEFYQKEITYFDEDGLVYWTMGGSSRRNNHHQPLQERKFIRVPII